MDEILIYFLIFLSSPKDMLIDFRERGREKNINWLPFIGAMTRDWTRNPGMCPDGELNPRTFDLWANTQPTEIHQPGQWWNFIKSSGSQHYSGDGEWDQEGIVPCTTQDRSCANFAKQMNFDFVLCILFCISPSWGHLFLLRSSDAPIPSSLLTLSS